MKSTKIKIPEMKSWDCIEYDPVEEWVPEEADRVDFWFNVAIGVKGEDGADNFGVHVVSEKMMSQISNKNSILLIPYYEDWNQIINLVKSKIKELSGPSWVSLSDELSKMFQWEYEDYKS